jgi:hypothetical protein
MTQFERNLAECYKYAGQLDNQTNCDNIFRIAHQSSMYFKVMKLTNGDVEIPLFLYRTWLGSKRDNDRMEYVINVPFSDEVPIKVAAKTSLLTYMNNKYQPYRRLVAVTLNDKRYYVAPGIILDANLNILLMYTIKHQSKDITVYVNSELYHNPDDFDKMLTGKVFAFLASNDIVTENEDDVQPNLIVSKNITDFLVLPTKVLKRDSMFDLNVNCNRIIRDRLLAAFDLKYNNAH